jgi:hypothetical protein
LFSILKSEALLGAALIFAAAGFLFEHAMTGKPVPSRA